LNKKVTTSITITEEQMEWVNENAINLSKFVRMKIEEEMND